MTFDVQRSSDPRVHTDNIKQLLKQTIEHVRADVDQVDDPKAQALFETSAEVLEGLVRAYDHYEQRSEQAWR